MARKTSISKLPDDVRKHIETCIAQGKMTLDELIADLRVRWPEETPSRSSVHRYSQKLERRLAAIKASTEAARMIHEQAGDDVDARSGALVALVQTELFDRILEFQEATDEDVDPVERIGLLSAAAKNIATLTRASFNLKKFQSEVDERAKQAAEAVSKLASKGGLSAATVDEMRRAILGVAK